MQKIKRTETLLESQGFFRFSSAIDVLMREGLVHGQVVQYSPGEGINQAIGFKSDLVGLVHVRFPHSACIRTGQPPGHVTFTLPVTDASDWTLNGIAGRQRTLFLNFGLDETELFAPNRNLIAGSVKTDFLLETMGALGGWEPDETDIHKGPLLIEQASFDALKSAFARTVYGSEYFDDPMATEQSVAMALAAVLNAGRKSPTRQIARSYEIFRTAIEYISNSNDHGLNVSSISAFCGVSTPTLTAAFHHVTGTSPSRYIRQLCLSDAHQALSAGSAKNLLVKSAASRSGFSQMGRFSRLYEQTYGALPSKVLWETSGSVSE
jgi:AraC-like DNA-binding protein